MLSQTSDNTDIILNSIALMFVFTADTDMVQESDKTYCKILLTYANLVLEDRKKESFEIVADKDHLSKKLISYDDYENNKDVSTIDDQAYGFTKRRSKNTADKENEYHDEYKKEFEM